MRHCAKNAGRSFQEVMAGHRKVCMGLRMLQEWGSMRNKIQEGSNLKTGLCNTRFKIQSFNPRKDTE